MEPSNRDELIQLLAEFVAAVTNMRLYPHDHPRVNSFVDRFFENLIKFFTQIPELTFFLFDDDIIAFDKPLVNPGLPGKSFRKILQDKKIERITLLAGLPKKQLHQFISDLASIDITSVSATSHIKLGKIIIDELENDLHPADKSFDLYMFKHKAAQELKSIYHSVKENRTPNLAKAQVIVNDFLKIYDRSINPLKIITQIKSSDDYTYVHITNVALLTICFADYLGFTVKNLEDIGVAALLHDVGKMFIPDEILNKEGPLNAYERAVMEKHPLKGAQYIGHQKFIPNLTMIAALEHHVRWDGSGYPMINNRWKTNIVSQMINIIDTYDALRSKRPYKEPLEYPKVRASLIAGKGSAYNPDLVDYFLQMIES